MSEAWRVNARVSLYVLSNLAPEALTAAAASKGRTVGAIFAHMHAVRLSWLEASAPELARGLGKLGREQASDQAALRESLEQSGRAVAALLQHAEQTGKLKGFKRSPATFMSYLIAHENYHLGEIGMTLKQAGHPLDSRTAYGMWEWDKL